jgi:D-erythrulose 1-phosphate 3-epimerase
MPPTIHLGINTCFAVKRWPEPEQWTHIIREELHLDHCQFSLDLVESLLDDEASSAAYADHTRDCATGADLHIHSTFTGLAAYSWSQLLHPIAAMRAAAVRWYERVIDFSSRLGAQGTGGHLGALSVLDASEKALREARQADMMEHLRHLLQYAGSHGLSFFLFENMAVPREIGHSIAEAHALAELDPPPGGVPLILCLDIGHPCALHTGTSSDDYRAWLAESWPTTPPVVHLQQTDRTGDHHWPFTAKYNSQGVIRAEAVVEAIQRWPDDAPVYLFLEPIHPFEADDALVLDELKESVRYWREALQG